MSRVRIHNFAISTRRLRHRRGAWGANPPFHEGLENRYEIESVSSPSGVMHLTFTRADR